MADHDDDAWDDYSSEQLFPGCECGHDATDHKAAWHDYRDGAGCLIAECSCDVEWEHT